MSRQRTIDYLNELFEADPAAVLGIFGHAVPCSAALEAHPHVIVGGPLSEGDTASLSPIGVINGLLGVFGFGAVAMEIDEDTDKLIGFCAYTPEMEAEPHPQNDLGAVIDRIISSDPSQIVFNHQLNSDHDTARAVHRIVRAMHDGECPKCHKLHDSTAMRRLVRSHRGDVINVIGNWTCPACGFFITPEESEAAMQHFAPFMEANLKVFEQWRAKLASKT
jgi:hypothetical protein